MPASLRVDPTRLESSATVMSRVGSDMSALRPGQSLADVPGALAGTSIATAASSAVEQLNTATRKLGGAVSGYSTKLSDSARQYAQTDRALGGDIDKVMEDEPKPDDGTGEPTTEADIAKWWDQWMQLQRDIADLNARRPPDGPGNAPAGQEWNREREALQKKIMQKFMEGIYMGIDISAGPPPGMQHGSPAGAVGAVGRAPVARARLS